MLIWGMKESNPLSVRSIIDSVAAFHDAFEIRNAPSPEAQPSEATVALRHRLMAEENEEYLEAAQAGDLVEVADALGDMLYILCGTILQHGMQDVIEEVFTEIQRSNMSKLGEDGRPIHREDGKVMKGPHYTRPDLSFVSDAAPAL
jgi:predicted HAD superfamily Cof-like phosphohydrolase